MSDGQGPTDQEPIRIVVSLGHTGDQTLYLRVSPEAAGEVQELMEEQGVYSGEILEFTHGPELVVIAGSIAAGLTGLAAVLRAYFTRHNGRNIKVTEGDSTFEVNGLPPEESDALIERLLEHARKRQLEQDKEWRRVLGRPEPNQPE